MRKLAELYIASSATIIAWCLGITQQEHGVDTIREIVNLLLLRGNIGREGAGPSPDPRALERPGQPHLRHQPPPDAAFLDRLAEVCGIDPPREHGLDTVRTIEAMHRGEVKVFVALGGNFVLAAPDLPLHDRGAAELRADGAGEHEAQPQPPRARQARADPAVPRPHRERPAARAACRA